MTDEGAASDGAFTQADVDAMVGRLEGIQRRQRVAPPTGYNGHGISFEAFLAGPVSELAGEHHSPSQREPSEPAGSTARKKPATDDRGIPKNEGEEEVEEEEELLEEIMDALLDGHVIRARNLGHRLEELVLENAWPGDSQTHTFPTNLDPCVFPFEPPSRVPAGPDGRPCDNIEHDLRRHEPECWPPPLGCNRKCTLGDTSSNGDSLQLSEASGSVSFDGRCHFSEEDKDYINAAWNLLQANLDICEWIACLLWGPDKADCIHDELTSGSPDISIVCDIGSNWSWWYCQVCPFISHDNHIHIDVTSSSWAGKMEDWRSSSGDPDRRTCYLVYFASVLFHELLHSCPGSGGRWNHDGDDVRCDKVFAAQNAFMWAMAQRYPCILNVPRCASYANACMWMNGINLVDGGCP